ncbi:MAG: 4-(cytidine 5'-diphospho)-2-C-methyl-D-erythritol kinase, partial [Thiomonas sp. 14-64-326]
MRALFNLPAPAKINWFLHVTGKRPDGYHTLQTVFQFIDWCDTLDLIQRDDGLIRRIGADELPQDDLCVRAARLLQQATQCESGVDIHLRKCIPQQAGLGGGSSDAATVLIGLNRLWRLD